MATAIAGTVDYTASIQAIDAASRLGNGCVDATETYAYFPDTANRRIFRLDIAAGTFTSIYGNTFQVAANPIRSMRIKPDGVTLTGGTNLVTGTAYYYEFLADGSTGTISQASTQTTMGLSRMVDDPSTGKWFVSDGTQTAVLTVDPASYGTPSAFFRPYARFISYAIRARYDNDKILLAITQSNSRYYICELSQKSGSVKVIAGDGSTSAIAAGSALVSPVGVAVHVDSDADGRVYVGSGSSVYSLINGTLASINASNYSNNGGIIYLPVSNKLLVCNGVYEVRRLS